MSESIKAVCVLFGFVTMVAGGVAWFLDGPDGLMWAMRIGGPLIALAALGIIIGLNSRADLVPDYLGAMTNRFFNRDGFCFATDFVEQNGIAHLDLWFQNQYEGPCHAQVVLRAGRGFWLSRPSFSEMAFEIECAPAGFGKARAPVAIPLHRQGKKQLLNVGAAVQFPYGKGKRLRFNDGIFIRTNTSFSNKVSITFAIIVALAGQLIITSPASAKHILPTNVAETLPKSIPPQVITYWELGDPPLQQQG